MDYGRIRLVTTSLLLLHIFSGCGCRDGLDDIERDDSDQSEGSVNDGGQREESSKDTGWHNSDWTEDSFVVGGTVTGLFGVGLILQNNGGFDIEILRNGVFTFPSTVPNSSVYDVTVRAHPSEPPQFCTVTNGSGRVKSGDVTGVAVACEAPVAIDRFSADQEEVLVKDEVALSWSTRSATSCRIDPGAIEATPTNDGNKRLTVNATTTFILTCEGPGGPVNSEPITVLVVDSGWNQVAAGINHTCATRKDGRLFCWGKGEDGQLGNNSVSRSLVPVQEHDTAIDWLQVSASGNYTCALKRDGRLFCWGFGEYGQLGSGSTSNRRTPTQENTAATDWLQVSAGWYHSCAVKRDGRLFCWGSGRYGQLGIDSTSYYYSPTQEYTAAEDWAQVSATGFHTCAVKADGRLFCWGDNSNGELGTDSTSSNRVLEQEDTGATDWAEVSAGGESRTHVRGAHTCAIKNDDRLFCWGSGEDGQLGNNSTSNRSTPTQEHTAESDWLQVSAGAHHTCAVKNDGRLFCWGAGGNGQLGNNSTTDSAVPVQEDTSAIDWLQVSVGGYHTCAVKKDGRLFCWGAGDSGQLGNNSTTDSAVPVQENTEAAD